MADIFEKSMDILSIDYAMNIFGNYDENIKIIEDAFKVKVLTRGTSIRISGANEDVSKAETVLTKLLDIAKLGQSITRQNVQYVVGLTNEKQIEKADEILTDYVCLTSKGKQIKYKTH